MVSLWFAYILSANGFNGGSILAILMVHDGFLYWVVVSMINLVFNMNNLAIDYLERHSEQLVTESSTVCSQHHDGYHDSP